MKPALELSEESPSTEQKPALSSCRVSTDITLLEELELELLLDEGTELLLEELELLDELELLEELLLLDELELLEELELLLDELLLDDVPGPSHDATTTLEPVISM